MLVAGDGNCAYRAMLIGLLEAAAVTDDSARQSLVQRIDTLYKQLPEWARSSFCGSSNVAFGYCVLKVSCFSNDHLLRDQCYYMLQCMTACGWLVAAGL